MFQPPEAQNIGTWQCHQCVLEAHVDHKMVVIVLFYVAALLKLIFKRHLLSFTMNVNLRSNNLGIAM